MAPRRRACPVCGSRRWHKEPTSGLITCSEGHVLQNYVNEAQEIDEMPAYAVRKRNLKSGRKKKERQSKADPKVYHGERARYHYLQCLQLILRMQVAALRRLWELPPEFEPVCRDVWAMHLSLLPEPPSAEPLDFLRDTYGAGDANDTKSPTIEENAILKSKIRGGGAAPEDHSDYEDTINKLQEHADEEDSSSSSSSESEGDDELSRLMRENSEVSSSSDESGQESKLQPEPSKKGRLHTPYDSPAGNLSVLIVTCWTLRLPVIYMDFIRLIEDYLLPYLDPVRFLPASLTRHLSKHTKKALSPHFAPSPLRVHGLTSRLAKLMYAEYRIYTPDLNAAPVLWRTVRGLCGTPTLYILAKKLARVLSVPLSLHRSLAANLNRSTPRDPNFHKKDDAIPEVALAAVVIVVLKMVYGLDDKPRYPRDKDDPACALPHISEYLSRINQLDERSRNAEDSPSSTVPIAIDLDDTQIDAYMDFCEKALLPREGSQLDEQNTITDFYPVNRPKTASSGSVAVSTAPEYPAMSATPLNPDETALLPGQAYPIYNTLDMFGVMPRDNEAVIKRAALWAGVDADYVCSTVERFERRLLRWWMRTGKKEAGGRDEDEDEDEND